MEGVVTNPLSERAKSLIELNAKHVGTDCPECGNEIVAVDIAKGVDPDPGHGVRTDVDAGDLILAHSDTPGDWCELPPDEINAN